MQTPNLTPTTTAPQTTATTRIILIRHGRSTYNVQGRYQGSSDVSVLTPEGFRSAYATGLALKNTPIDVIYASPLKRIQQTTQAILSAFGDAQQPSVETSELLSEINMSVWQGLTYDYVRQNWASAYRCWQLTPHLFKFPLADSEDFTRPVIDLYDQVKGFWKQVLKKHWGQTILIVGHSGTNRALISTAIGLPPHRYHTLQQSNCGISQLQFTRPSLGQAKLTALNLTNHLGESLPKLKAGKQGLRLIILEAKANKDDQKLIDSLPAATVDFVLSDDLKDSAIIVKKILAVQPQSVHRIVNSQVASAWRFTLAEIIQNLTQSLTTGVVVAQESIVELILAQTGLQLGSYMAGISILHYPQKDTPAIIQSIGYC